MIFSAASFLDNYLWIKLLIEGYLLFIILFIILKFVLRNRKAFDLSLINLIIFGLYALSDFLELKACTPLFRYIALIMPILIIVMLMPDIRKQLNSSGKFDIKQEILNSSNSDTKNSIVDAVMFLAARKIGALITIENHNSLDQYSEKAIQLNSDVSKELLINIFTPLTPLHDGGVIIRGNKIRCAGAYYVLAQKDDLDKTTGSRHRAGLGISEVSDSLTIIVSEETGNVSLAIEGMMIKANEKEKILEYLDMFLK